MNKRLHLIIRGKVQGVFFRDNTRRRATSLEITGWIRNNSDGTVEAVFEGPEEKLKEILKICEQSPGSSQVDKVEKNWEVFTGEFNQFEIRH